MKMYLLLALLLIAGPAFARGSTGGPLIPACHVEHNKCVYPQATLKEKNFFNRLNRWLRKVGPHTDKP